MKQNVTIIGGGPAGSTAAILLARRGWDVTLVEQSRFPREKVCGECLSALGFEVLSRLGLAGAFHLAGAIRLDRAVVHGASGKSIDVELPTPMWGLSRAAFDELLLNAAKNAGANILQPARCEAIEPHIVIRDLISNAINTVHADHVIVADGKASFAHDSPSPTGDLGIKTHFTDVDGPRDAIELFGIAGSYGGLAAIEGNRWDAAFSVPAARVKAHRGDIDALFAEIFGENETLRRRVASAERCADWLAAPLPRFAVRRNWPANVVPVGNAAAALEPIGGEGMGLAMRSAELAVEQLLSESDSSRAELATHYQRLWRTKRFACRAAAVAVSRPMLGKALLSQAVAPRLARVAMRLIGK